MISHVHIGVDDFETALRFYSSVLPTLGWRSRFIDRQRPWAGWMPKDVERPLLLIGAPFDGEPAAPGNGQMVALLAPRRQAVDDFHVLALANGAACEGPLHHQAKARAIPEQQCDPVCSFVTLRRRHRVTLTRPKADAPRDAFARSGHG